MEAYAMLKVWPRYLRMVVSRSRWVESVFLGTERRRMA